MLKVEPLPKWLSRRYAKLWEAFRDDEFSFESAVDTLGDDSRIVSLSLSELNRRGWIENIRSNPEDTRKKLYKLVPLEQAFTSIAKEKVVA